MGTLLQNYNSVDYSSRNMTREVAETSVGAVVAAADHCPLIARTMAWCPNFHFPLEYLDLEQMYVSPDTQVNCRAEVQGHSSAVEKLLPSLLA